MHKTGYYEAARIEVVRLLQEKRKRQNLSNYAVSQLSGISETMLSRIASGERIPSFEVMLRMADAVGVDFPALIKKAQQVAEKKSRQA